VKRHEPRTRVLSVLAHDLRKPVNALSTGLQYILRSEATAYGSAAKNRLL